MKHLKVNPSSELAADKGIKHTPSANGMKFIPFKAETRSSGIDLGDGTKIRKGASDAIKNMVKKPVTDFLLKRKRK